MTAADLDGGLNPDWSIHPGEVLRDVLEERGIRQAELAARAGLTAKHINQIIKGNVGVSGDVAVVLGRALQLAPQFWTKLDADYEAHIAITKARSALPEFYSWADAFDQQTLQRHGVVAPSDDWPTRAEKVLSFFGVANPTAFETIWLRPRVSFRRSQAFDVAEQNTALWLRLVERRAETAPVGSLSPRALRRVAKTIPGMTTLNLTDGYIAARTALAEAGVVLTFVRQVPGTRVCAATSWLGPDRPVIGLTERGRKPDMFWFSLVHEIGHILLHPRRTTFLDIEGEKATAGHEETEADAFAESTLVPAEAQERIANARTRDDLVLIAARLGVGTTIIAGQHGHLTGRWQVGASLRGKIADTDLDQLERL